MSDRCGHLTTINTVTPGSRGCEECLKSGSMECISVHEAFGNLPDRTPQPGPIPRCG